MSNSPLVRTTILSPNHSGKRTMKIDRITPHCVVGHTSLTRLGNIFLPASRKASSNYGLDDEGQVGMYVEECNRSWCTSSNANDQRAVTIEIASDSTAPYAITDGAWKGLIELCVDICQRNGKKKLLWLKDKAVTLDYAPAADEMVLTVHRWFAAKSCPGDYIYSRLGALAEEVTKRLGGNTASHAGDNAQQADSPQNGDKAKQAKSVLEASNAFLTGFEKPADQGEAVQKKRAAYGESFYNLYAAPTSYLVKITASCLNVRAGSGTNYKVNTTVRKGEVYTIVETKDGWGRLKSGAGWICLSYTTRV